MSCMRSGYSEVAHRSLTFPSASTGFDWSRLGQDQNGATGPTQPAQPGVGPSLWVVRASGLVLRMLHVTTFSLISLKTQLDQAHKLFGFFFFLPLLSSCAFCPFLGPLIVLALVLYELGGTWALVS